jgi:hypothetical protein
MTPIYCRGVDNELYVVAFRRKAHSRKANKPPEWLKKPMKVVDASVSNERNTIGMEQIPPLARERFQKLTEVPLHEPEPATITDEEAIKNAQADQ